MRLTVVLCVVLLPGLMLAPVWQLAGLGASEDDVLYYFPMRQYFADLAQDGHLPWLNPWTGLGRPYLADPQTALWYPTTWLFAVLDPLQAYPASLWIHYSLALWGMYRLLRLQQVDPRAALFGGIAFAFCGFLLAHRAHFTMQHAAAWTPWVFWALLRYAGPGNPALQPSRSSRAARGPVDEFVFFPGQRQPRDVRRLVLAGLIVTMPCLAGHVQIAALLALASLLFLLAQPAPQPEFRLRFRATVLLRWLLAWTCAAGVFAIQWLPTFEYMRICTRVQRGYADFVENSWHPIAVIGWLLPMLLGQRTPNFFPHEWWGPWHQVELFAYAGIAPLVLALLAVVVTGWRDDPRRRPWIVLGLFGLLLALGEYGPICPILYYLPGSSLFRCPARALLIANIAVAALAAFGLQSFSTAGARRSPLRSALLTWTRRPVLLASVLVLLPLGYLLLCLPFVDAPIRAAAWIVLRPWNPALWVPIALIFATVLTVTLIARQPKNPALLWLPILLTVLDLGLIGWTLDVPAQRTTPQALLTPAPGSDWMDLVRDSGERLWVVNTRVSGKPGEYIRSVDKAVANTNLLRGIPVLTDYGPFQPRSYIERFNFKPWGETDDAPRLLENTRWMRLYNIGWVLVCGDLPAPADCELTLTTPEGWRLYRCAFAAGMAAFEGAAQPGIVRFERQSPYRFTTGFDTWFPGAPPRPKPRDAETQRATWPLLVTSQINVPGWTARLDSGDSSLDKNLPLESAEGALLAVRVPPGQAGTIEWTYSPPGFFAGAAISALSLAVLLAALVWSILASPPGRP